MEFQFKKHIKIVVEFEVGEEVLIRGWGAKVDGKHTIEAIKLGLGSCESGIMVKHSGYHAFMDIAWLTKIDDSVSGITVTEEMAVKEGIIKIKEG